MNGGIDPPIDPQDTTKLGSTLGLGSKTNLEATDSNEPQEPTATTSAENRGSKLTDGDVIPDAFSIQQNKGCELIQNGSVTDTAVIMNGDHHHPSEVGDSNPAARTDYFDTDKAYSCHNYCQLSGSNDDDDSSDSTVESSETSKQSVAWPGCDLSQRSQSNLSVHEGSYYTSSDDERSSVGSSSALGPFDGGMGTSSTTRALQYRGLPSSVPVRGESFCDCPLTTQATNYSHRRLQNVEVLPDRYLMCMCGEDDLCLEWTWDVDSKSSATEVSADTKQSYFHQNYSSGTAAVRGNKLLSEHQHYWEIKMISPVYGTDMMVGVGTRTVDLDAVRNHFCSFLGRNGDSWGFSYMGHLYHKGWYKSYGARFGQGTILGVHLDMWHGTLSFYKNRQPLGVAFRGLQGKKLYPMVSSTAAQSGMKLIQACSFRTSLQFFCCQVLRQMIPHQLNVLDELQLPPGLKDYLRQELLWLLGPQADTRSQDKPTSTKERSEAGPKRKMRRLQKPPVMMDSDFEQCFPSSSTSSEAGSSAVNGDENLSGGLLYYLRPNEGCSSTSLSLPISLPQTSASLSAESSSCPQPGCIPGSSMCTQTEATSVDPIVSSGQLSDNHTIGSRSHGTVNQELTRIRDTVEQSRSSNLQELLDVKDSAPETRL